MKKHIIVITTGGTIAMKKDPETAASFLLYLEKIWQLPFPDFLTGQTFPSSNSPTCRAAG